MAGGALHARRQALRYRRRDQRDPALPHRTGAVGGMRQVMVSGDTQSDAMRPSTSLVAQMELAWNKGDPQAFAACFGEQADFIDMLGGHGVGKAMVEQAHRVMFSGAFSKSRIEYRIDKLKPIGQRTMILFLRSKL